MSDYLPTYLYVVKNATSTSQQNISVLYSFTYALASIPIALAVRYIRRLKFLTLIGCILLTLGFGLMLKINHTSTSLFDIVSAQVVIGLGGAFSIATIQSNVQVCVSHSLVARSISSLNIFSSIGNAIGASIAGSLWTTLIPNNLYKVLSEEEQSQISSIFSEPLTWILDNPIGSDVRSNVIEAYHQTYNIMMVVAISICAVTIGLTLVMENPRLGDTITAVCNCGDGEDEEVEGLKVYPCACKAKEIEGESSNLVGETLFKRVEGFFPRSRTTSRVT